MTNPTATVSVLVPCFNAERFLAETLESVRRQTLAPVEVIVVDDASTDRSREIAAAHAPFVTLLSNPGKGASAARNCASKAARGDYFQYLDADDLLEPQAIASRVEALQRTGCDVAIGDWQRIEEKGGAWQPVKVEVGRMPDSAAPRDLEVFRGFWAPPAAILYRRSVWERIGGWKESLPVIQDARFLLDAARLGGGFAHVPGISASYRQHASNSLSSTSSVKFWADILQNTREVEQLWREAGRLDPMHRAALMGAYDTAARVGFSRDRPLFEAACAELARFPEHRPSRFVRAASLISSLAGYKAACRLLAPFIR